MFKKKQSKMTVAVSSSPGVAAVPGSSIPVSQEELTLANSEFNIHKITDIQNRFHGGVELLVPGRIFVREGTLVKVCRKGPKPRQFFLFNDILIYGTILPTKGRYAAQHSLDLQNMTVTSDCHFMPSVYTAHSKELDVDSENAFQINHMEKSFHVFASSLADKANWIHNLKKYIGKRSAGKQDSANVATKAVWVPDDRVNNCMGCEVKFTTFNRKHHCRYCGKVVCKDCSAHKVDVSAMRGALKPDGKLERVCNDCYQLSIADPHKGKSPPTSPRGSPKARSKPTVIDSRPGASPEKQSVLAQAGFTGATGSSSPPPDDRQKKPAPVRPPPPSSSPPADLVSKAKERRLRMDSGTFDRPTSKVAVQSLPRDASVSEERMDEGIDDDDYVSDQEREEEKSESSSDSDDSAEIDLDDVEEGDPFMMQRANSESPLHGSLTDEALGAIVQNIQTNIRLSTVDPDISEEDLATLMTESAIGQPPDAVVVCSKCSCKCNRGEYGRLNDQFLCEKDFHFTVKSSRSMDTSSVTKPATQMAAPVPTGRQGPARPAQAPTRPARKTDSPAAGAAETTQPMRPKPRQRIATASDGKEDLVAKKEENSGAAATDGATGQSDVDRLLTMTPEEQKPAEEATPLVTLATDPPNLSSQPLVPLPAESTSPEPAVTGAAAAVSPSTASPAAITGKKFTDRRKKKFKSSPAKEATVTTPSPEPAAVTSPDADSEQKPAITEEPENVLSEPLKSAGEEEATATGDLVDVSEPTAQASATANETSEDSPSKAMAADASVDLLDFGEPDSKGATSGKVTSRAEKRKNKFKKKEAT